MSEGSQAVTVAARRKLCDANVRRVHKQRGTLKSTPSTHSTKLSYAMRGVKVKKISRSRVSVNFTKKPSPLHTKLTSLSESTNCKPKRVNITLQNLHPTAVF